MRRSWGEEKDGTEEEGTFVCITNRLTYVPGQVLEMLAHLKIQKQISKSVPT